MRGPELTGSPAQHRLWFAVALAACWAAGAVGAENGKARLLPDTTGSITSVALAVNSARRSTLRNAELISNIVNGLPERVSIRILANDLSAFTVARNPHPERIRFVEMPAANPITIWTQDPFLVLETPGGETTLLTPARFDRAGDEAIAERLARESGLGTRRSRLHFEGGNIVSNERHVFIGANTIRYNAVEMGLSEVDIVAGFEQELGRPVLVVGPLPQPIAHIDMMLTPLDDERVALADSAWGARLVRELLEEDPQALARFETTLEDRFFGHPDIESIHGPDGQPISAPDLGDFTARAARASERLGPILDEVAAALGRHGYGVVRIPLLHGGPGAFPRIDDDRSFEAEFPMLTYNNVLLEAFGGTRKVYLPRYGLEALDDAARSAWTKAGFTPVAIDGLATSAMYGGALRCSVKVLAREPG